MAGEKTRVKLLIDKIQFTGSKITDKASVTAATWDDQPLTLRDDELILEEATPEEEEIFSHELDSALDYSITGASVTATGSFVQATVEQLVSLLGGKADGSVFMKSAKKLMIDKAIRFTFKEGGWVVFTRAKGFTTLNLNVGRGGRAKYPFKFIALAADGSEYDLIWDTTGTATAPETTK